MLARCHGRPAAARANNARGTNNGSVATAPQHDCARLIQRRRVRDNGSRQERRIDLGIRTRAARLQVSCSTSELGQWRCSSIDGPYGGPAGVRASKRRTCGRDGPQPKPIHGCCGTAPNATWLAPHSSGLWPDDAPGRIRTFTSPVSKERSTIELQKHVPTLGIEPRCPGLQPGAWTTIAKSAKCAPYEDRTRLTGLTSRRPHQMPNGA